MAFSGWLPVQAMPATPDSSQCTISSETVTCSGDLSDGVAVNNDESSTYTELIVNDLSSDIIPAAGIMGITFTNSNNSDIGITVNTGDFNITTSKDAIDASTDGNDAIHAYNSGGGDISIEMIGDIYTDTNNSEGIYAVTTGDGNVEVLVTGDINTLGDLSEAIYALSSDGDITVEMTGDINTVGDFSHAISTISNKGNIMLTTTGNINTEGFGSRGINSESNNGDITISATGDINTDDHHGDGIFAQTDEGSITITLKGNINTKGGNSDGINAISKYNGENTSDISILVIGDITADGYASDGIDIRSEEDAVLAINGNIKTSGYGSDGVYAYSNNGDIKIVKFDWKTIITRGDNSAGILTYSNAGDTLIDIRGRIITEGNLSRAIEAYSDEDVNIFAKGFFKTMGTDSDAIYATTNKGSINVNLLGGMTVIKAISGNGVHFEGGLEVQLNQLTTSPGTLAIISGSGTFQRDGETHTGIDIRGGNGDDSITNRGVLISRGSIDLGKGRNAFKNWTGGIFVSGKSVDLGHGNEFTNDGDFSPGGIRNVQHTTLTGDFSSSDEGSFTVTLKPTANRLKNDKLIINGMATLEGGVVIVKGVRHAYDDSYTILTASDGISGKFDSVIDTLFIDNRLSYVDDSVILSSTSKGTKASRFARTANQRSVASQGLDTLLASGQSNAVTQAVLNLTTTDQAEAAYDGLSGEVHASLKGALLGADQLKMAAINRRIHRQPGQPGAQPAATAFGNLSSFVDDQSGFWITGYRSESETDASFNTAEMDTDLDGILLGMERELAEHWRFGVLGGYGQTAVDQPERSSFASVDTWSLGLYGGADNSASSLSFGAIYSSDAVDTSRSIHIDDLSEHLSASYGAHSWQLFTEAAHQIQAGNV